MHHSTCPIPGIWLCPGCAPLFGYVSVPTSITDARCAHCGAPPPVSEALLAEIRELRRELSQRLEPAKPDPRSAVPPPDAMTPKEAFRYLRLSSVRALYAAVRKGQVPVHRLGPRRMRFFRAELDAVLARR